MKSTQSVSVVPLRGPLFRGERRLRIALVGMPNSGKSTLFQAVSSTSIHVGEIAGTHQSYRECTVQIGLDEASLIDLPSLHSMHHLQRADLGALKYLLWGDQRPPVSIHETEGPAAPFSPPDVIIQVVDATALERHLELTMELCQLGRPVVLALNMMDEARAKGLHIGTRALSQQLGIPVIPTIAMMGHGISKLFTTAVESVRAKSCPLPQPSSKHIQEALRPLSEELHCAAIQDAFSVPHAFLLAQIAEGNQYFLQEIEHHFPELLPKLLRLREQAEDGLPRPLAEEVHADRHHRAASLFEEVTRIGGPYEGKRWRYWLDELFLHPQWGLIGSLVVFAMILFIVFEVSAWLDAMTSARLVEWISVWQPQSTMGVIGRAIADGLIGLIGIVVPYMIPLVMLLVALEEAGVMQRIAFVVDRGFHHLGLHGGVAVPFLLGFGCNVPAISAAANASQGRERVVSALLITFVPCSARSAIILALAGKYLGGFGVLAIFLTTALVIALVGKLLTRKYPETTPGQVQEIPPYAMPEWRSLLRSTANRTSDIITIVTPLLIGGSILLAMLSHFGADQAINTVLTPITHWWLGLPVVLGVPILFGILRKELSLLMIYQALGSFEIGQYMDWVQITTFLLFLTFYIPCVSTFAVMLKKIGAREAFYSVFLSVSVALLVSGAIRFALEAGRVIAG